MTAASLPLIYLCRHGQTDWNAEGRIQGQEDTPLNMTGRTQARRNGRYLRNVLGAAVKDFHFLASPLHRTRETMRIIRHECGLAPDDFATDARLMELNFGDWQTHTISEIEAKDAAMLAGRDADKWNFRPPGAAGESYEMLAERAGPVFASLDRPSVIVAHGGITRVFMKLFAGMPGADAAHARVFQDRILKAENGQIAWV